MSLFGGLAFVPCGAQAGVARVRNRNERKRESVSKNGSGIRMNRGAGRDREAFTPRKAQDTAKAALSSETCVETDLNAWRRLWRTAGEEMDYIVPQDDIEGVLPEDLIGTLFVNGPGMLERNGEELKHPWDGDGMVSAVGFRDGEVWFRNRYVRTRYFLTEERAGKFLFRGDFRQMKPGGALANALILKSKNPANVNVVFWADRLLALCDTKPPHLLDTQSLATLGQSRLGGVLDEPGLGGVGGFTAHPKIDPHSNRLVGFSAKVSDRVLEFIEFDEEFKQVSKRAIKLQNVPFVHDFIITRKYYIVLDSPVDINPLPFILGLRAPAQCLSFDSSRPTRIILTPRDDPSAESIVVEHDAFFCFHFANAFEDEESGDVVIDLVTSDTLMFDSGDTTKPVYDVDFETQVPQSCLKRMRISLGKNTPAQEQQQLQKQQPQRALVSSFSAFGDGEYCEFPSINSKYTGSPHSFVYSIVRVDDGSGSKGPHNALRKVDVRTGDSQVFTGRAHEFFNEPVFVPKASGGARAEDDGYILSYCMNGLDRSVSLIVLDAARFEHGPVCRISLKTFFPYTLHGTWTPKCWDRDENRSKTSTHEIFASKGWNDFNSNFSSFGGNALF